MGECLDRFTEGAAGARSKIKGQGLTKNVGLGLSITNAESTCHFFCVVYDVWTL